MELRMGSWGRKLRERMQDLQHSSVRSKQRPSGKVLENAKVGLSKLRAAFMAESALNTNLGLR